MKSIIKKSVLAVIAACSLVSCAKDELKPAATEKSLHFVINTAENSTMKSFVENNLDGTYTPKWTNGDELAIFIGTINDKTSSPTATLSNTAETGTTASFDGTVPTDLTEGSFLSFSPAAAFAKGYSDGTVGINLSEIQKPSSLTIDEACDVLVAKPCDFTADNGTVKIDDLFFKRIFSVVKVNLTGDAALNGEKVTSFTLSAPATLTGRAAVNLSTASISQWTSSNESIVAKYTTDNPAFGGENGLENTVWFVVNPTTVASGSVVTFSGETENYTFSKEVTLSKDLVFPQSQIAVINLSIGEGNYTAKTAETRIFVEGFDNVETTKTQLQPSVTGASGTGVTESLAYTYSSKNTNLRFNSNGHSSTNPYLYLSLANDNLIISNIKISGESALKFSYQAKTTSGSSTITINYKESSSDVWTEVGTSTAGTGTFDTVNSKVFNVSSEATSIDLQIVGSATALVDDLVLESFVDTRTTLSTPANVSASVDAETPNKVNVSWGAVENASGYEVVLSSDGKEDIVNTTSASPLAVSGLDYSTTYSVKVKATTTDVENYIDSEYSAAVSVTTEEQGSVVEDKLVSSLFPANSTTYVDFTGVKVLSNAVYAGNSSYNNNGISLRSTNPSGIVSTTSGGKVKSVVVEWISNTTSGRTIDVYGKNTAYSTAADLYSTTSQGTKIGTIVYGTSTELTISDDYQYIGLRSNNGALYVSSITISWDASGSSEGGSEAVKLAAPAVSCTAKTETSLTFSWAAVANASGYQVSVDGGSTYGATQTETTYTWTGLTASTSYTLYVKAIGDGTNYTDSDAASAEDKTTDGSGSGEESKVYLSEDFASLTTWGTSSKSSFDLTSGTWTASGSVFEQNGCIKIGSKTAGTNNSITTPALSSISGTADVVLTFKAVSSDSGYTMSVVANNAGTVGELSPSSITQNGTAINNGESSATALTEAFAASTATFTVTITGATSSTTLTIKTSGNSKRWYLDDVKVVHAK